MERKLAERNRKCPRQCVQSTIYQPAVIIDYEVRSWCRWIVSFVFVLTQALNKTGNEWVGTQDRLFKMISITNRVTLECHRNPRIMCCAIRENKALVQLALF